MGVLGFLLVCLVVKATTSPFPSIETSHEQEQVFRTGPSTTQPFPSLGQFHHTALPQLRSVVCSRLQVRIPFMRNHGDINAWNKEDNMERTWIQTVTLS
jgi:hypothetical protein